LRISDSVLMPQAVQAKPQPPRPADRAARNRPGKRIVPRWAHGPIATAVPNAAGVSVPIIRNSHPAKIAVAIAIRAKSRLARASVRRHQTRTCTRASVRQADAIIDQMMVTQFMVS